MALNGTKVLRKPISQPGPGSDVQTYFKNLNQKLNVPVAGVSLNGVAVACTKCEDSEQVPGIEIAVSRAPGLGRVVVHVGSNDVSIFNQMAPDNTSKQLSCSWGWKEDESSLDPIFKEFAAQGQSLFVASGDQGSNTVAGEVWPADGPYVTAVGGADLATSGAGGTWKSETGWSRSAGMPSKNNIPILSYQQLAGRTSLAIASRSSAVRVLRDEALGRFAARPENDILVGGQLRTLRFHCAECVVARHDQDHVRGVERVLCR